MNIRNLTLTMLALSVLALVSCGPNLDAQVATLNARATEIANIGQEFVPTVDAVLHPTPTPTIPIVAHDLTMDSGLLLSSAWGETYALAGGTPFTISATQEQASVFIAQVMNLNGWGGVVFDPSVAIGIGQFRMDFGVVTPGGSGQATVTFQPTLNAAGGVELNSLGADFGAMSPPAGLTFALGDAVLTTLTGQSSAALRQVRLTEVWLQDGTMRVSGITTD